MNAWSWWLAWVALLPAAAGAQEVIFNGLQWRYPDEASRTLPTWKVLPQIDQPLPDLLAGYVITVQYVNSQGSSVIRLQAGSDDAYRQVLHRALMGAKIQPAQEEGRSVDAQVWFATIFNPRSATAGPAEAAPRLRQVFPVEIPFVSGAGRRPPQGEVTVLICPDRRVELVALKGARLTPEDRTAATATIQRWRFDPARLADQWAFGEVRLPVVFLPIEPEAYRYDKPPQPLRTVKPEYPLWQRLLKKQGEVTAGLLVDREGRVVDAQVQRSDNPALDQAVLKAVRQWTFRPAVRHGVTVEARLQVPIRFNMRLKNDDEKQADAGSADSNTVFDQPPRWKKQPPLVYPQALGGTAGSGRAVVGIIVGRTGRVETSWIKAASAWEFGRALQMMLESGEFEPARRQGEPVTARLEIRRSFTPEPDPGPAFAIADLDAEPDCIDVCPPVFPTALVGVEKEGSARIVFVVDQNGRIRQPEILQSTHPLFGYAAVQAVAQRRYTIPQRKGRPVAARMATTVQFSRPGG